MPKFELTLTTTYNVKPEYMEDAYGTEDPHEALTIDVAQYSDDPGLLFEGEHDFILTGRVLND